MLRTLVFAMVALVGTVASAKQINITVMVPGIQAFSYLAMDSEPLPDHTGEYQDVASTQGHPVGDTYQTDILTEDDDTGNIDEPAEHDDEYLYSDYLHGYCIGDDGLPDIECLAGDYNIYPWSYVFAKPALDLALEEIRATPGLLENFDIQLHYFDSSNANGFASSR